jgi:hypothetical protein
MPQGYRHEGSPATDTPPAPVPQPATASAATNGHNGSSTTTGTTTNVVATSTARRNEANVQITTAHATPVATAATVEEARQHPTASDPVHTGALTHTTDTHTHTPHTHTQPTRPTLPQPPTPGRRHPYPWGWGDRRLQGEGDLQKLANWSQIDRAARVSYYGVLEFGQCAMQSHVRAHGR